MAIFKYCKWAFQANTNRRQNRDTENLIDLTSLISLDIQYTYMVSKSISKMAVLAKNAVRIVAFLTEVDFRVQSFDQLFYR